MSAIRPNANRRSNRSEISSPYGRRSKRRNSDDTNNQSSGWGISKFLFGLFKRSSSQYDEDLSYENAAEDQEMDSSVEHPRVIRRSPSIEEISPPQTQAKHTDPPRTPSVPSDEEQIPSSKVQQVTKYLTEKGNKPLNNVEVAGLVALLEASVQEELNPPFRFSPSPLTTPVRGISPNASFMGSSSSAPALATSSSATHTSGKSLLKNPNGVYRWQGAGSARPRTRYQSPGFGTSRSMPIKMKLTSEVSTSDKKRRRVGQDSESSSIQRASPPADPPATERTSTSAGSSAPLVNGDTRSTSPTPPRPNGVIPPTTPRIRTNNLPTKPTAPAVPSPLRQAWNQNDSPPQSIPASKPTRAANIMSELIKEASPAPRPDFSNPYDSAGPVPAKTATRRPVVKRSRVVAASHAEMKHAEKVVDLSPQKIIEATVPKGSKRSRPPPNLDSTIPKVNAPDPVVPRRSSRLKSPEPQGINGIAVIANGNKPAQPTEDVDESPTKKQKTASSSSLLNGKKTTVTIEEVEDVDMPSSNASYSNVTRPAQIIEPEENTTSRQRSQSPTASTSPTSPVRNHFGLKSSVPKAPSKLRYSIQVEGESDKGEDEETKAPLSFSSLPPLAPSSSLSSNTTPAVSSSPSIGASSVRRSKSTPKSEAEVKAEVLALAPHELPSFSFALPTSSPGAGPGPSSQKSRDAANAISASSLPTFNFSDFAQTAASTSSAHKPSEGFSFGAAGMKSPSAAPPGGWQCSDCLLMNPATATDKCSICDAPRRKPAPTPVAGGFNWAAAGMKKPETGAGGSEWICSTCMLSNPASATTKCSVCDAPR